MNRFVVLALSVSLGACDLQPAPKPVAVPPKTADLAPAAIRDTPPAPPPDAAIAPAPPPVALTDAGVARAPADALLETTQPCNAVGIRIAATLIADQPDPQEKAVLEQERTKLVRSTAEVCTRDGWSEKARQCFLDAKSAKEIQQCGKGLKAPASP